MWHAHTTPRVPEVVYFRGIEIQHSPAERSLVPRHSASSSVSRIGQGASRALTSYSSASWETPLHQTRAENALPTTSLGLLLPNTAPKQVLLSTVRAAAYCCSGALCHQDNQPWGSPTGSGCPPKQSPPDVLGTPGSFCSEALGTQRKTGSSVCSNLVLRRERLRTSPNLERRLTVLQVQTSPRLPAKEFSAWGHNLHGVTLSTTLHRDTAWPKPCPTSTNRGTPLTVSSGTWGPRGKHRPTHRALAGW